MYRQRLTRFLLISGALHFVLLATAVPRLETSESRDLAVSGTLRAMLAPAVPQAKPPAPVPLSDARVGGETAATPPPRTGNRPMRPIRPQRQRAAQPVKPAAIRYQPIAAPADDRALRRSVDQSLDERSTVGKEHPPQNSAQAAPAQPQGPSTAQLAQWQSRIRARLTEHMQQQFSYPLLARRRGWQGVVRLRFIVTTRGQITNVELASSSGYRLLDTSALDSAAQIRELPGILNAAGSTAPIKVEIPVRFLLRG